MTYLRIFTPIGTKEFTNFIVNFKKDSSIPLPTYLLEESPYSKQFKEIEIDQRAFSTRLDLGEYLLHRLEAIPRDKLIENEGLWNWLSLFWLDQLIPVDPKGKRVVGEYARYVYNPHYTTFYRHLVAASWDIFSRYGDQSKIFLSSPINITNRFIIDLACRQNLISNGNLIQVVQSLYWLSDGKTREGIKRGAVSKKKPGNLSRLIAVLNQLDTTYDLYAMNPKDIVDLLPKEFDYWRTGKAVKKKSRLFLFR